MNPSNTGKCVFQLQEAVQQSMYSLEMEASRPVSLQLVNDLVAPLTIVGDAQVLQRIIYLLADAAVRFVGASRVMVSMKQLLQAGNEVLVEFEISDNGPSISGEDKSCFFSYKRCLAEARMLVKQQGGKSVVNSLYGVGSTFKFVLKYRIVQKEDAQPDVFASMGGLAGKKVLLAEDNELNQRMIAHLLRREGVQVDIASDGKEAVELFEKNVDYDLMLLDLQLPLMDGFQSAIYIRKKLKSNVPIIAITAGFYSNAQARCLEVGINRYITKPLQPAELLQNVNFFLKPRSL